MTLSEDANKHTMVPKPINILHASAFPAKAQMFSHFHSHC